MQIFSASANIHALRALLWQALPAELIAPPDCILLEHLVAAPDKLGHSISATTAQQLPLSAARARASTTTRVDLVERLTSPAATTGSRHVFGFTTEKRTSDGRLSCNGPSALLPRAEPSGKISPPQPRRRRPTRPLVLITVNRHEVDAVLEVFLGESKHTQTERGGLVYDRLGVHGGFDIWHTTTEMGASGPGATQTRVSEIIAELKPIAVLAVGIAFGVNPDKQPIGQVLVSEKLQAYEPQRVGNEPLLRGDRVTPSTDWLQRAKAADGRWRRVTTAVWPRVQFGLLLSGEKLVDNVAYRDQLLKLTGGEAIGGEMEGAGLYAATHARKVDWLVIKAVCDYADGNKSQDKQERQRHAARCAARVARAVVDIGWDPADQPRPPAYRAMGITDLDKAGALIPAKAVRISLKAVTVESNAELARADNNDVDVQDALIGWLKQTDASPLFALLGEYGMGKTIACQLLVRTVDELRRDDPSLPAPLYFDLRNMTGLRERVPTLDDVLQECMARGWDSSAAPVPSLAQVHGLVRDGAIVVFDGLDEVLVHLREADGQTFTQQVVGILPRVDGNGRQRSRLLISCRSHYFRNLRDQHVHFTGQDTNRRTPRELDALILLPFGDRQVEHYLAAVLPDRNLSEVKATIASVHDLSELTSRPYTLRLIGELLPRIELLRAQGRRVYGVTLYREMVLRWLEVDTRKHHLKPDHKRRLAAHLASELWRRGQRIVPIETLENWFQRWLVTQPDIASRCAGFHPDWLEEDLRTATFLVREDGNTASQSGFRFAHSSLQEYFLAEHLYQSVREDNPSAWALPMPSQETRHFLGQLLAEGNDTDLQRLTRWSRRYRARVSELLLQYADDARSARPPLPCPDLAGMDLTGAQLSGCNLGRANSFIPVWNLGALNLSNADLSRARIHRVRMDGADLSGASVDHAELRGGSARYAKLHNVNLYKTMFFEVDLSGTSLSGCDIYHTQFLLCKPSGSTAAQVESGSQARTLVDEQPLKGAARASTTACCWSPDGTRVVSASDDFRVCIWDAFTGSPLVTLKKGHQGAISACAWSPDGQYILSASEDRTLRIWNVETGSPILSLRGHERGVGACAWSHDGRRVLSVSSDQTLRSWDALTGLPQLNIRIGEHPAVSVAWSADALRILSASVDEVLKSWHIRSTSLVFTLYGCLYPEIICTWSSDDQHVLTASGDGTVRIWESLHGTLVLTIRSNQRWVNAHAWSPDGSRILSSFNDGTVRIFNSETRTEMCRILAHSQ